MKKLALILSLHFLFSLCYAIDIVELKKMGIKTAKLAKRKWEKLLREQPELKEYVSRPSYRNLLKKSRLKKGIDTINVLAIRVEFQEDDDTLTTGNGLMDRDHNEYPYDSLGYPTQGYRQIGEEAWDYPFDSLVGNRGYPNLWYDPPHTKRYFEHLLEFVQKYWWEVSDHRVWLKYKVVPEPESACYKLPHTLLYYGDIYNYVRGILTLFRDAVVICDQESPEIDFSKYARDQGAIVVFHAGASWQTDWGNSPYDIPDCFIAGIDKYFGAPIWVDNGEVPIVDGILYSETAFQDGHPSYLQGGLCHEFGHQLGLPDLYDTELKTFGLGGWGLMGTGNWNLNGLLPPYPCAWSMEKLGFIEPVELTNDTTDVPIYARCGQDIEVKVPKIYKIPINSREYFLIEGRFRWLSQDTTVYKLTADSITDPWYVDSTGIRVWKDGVLVSFYGYYDWGLPPDSANGGLAIWHIDEEKVAKDSSENKINVGTPKGVDMEEADGIQDFETPRLQITDLSRIPYVMYGSKWDVFYKGNRDNFTPYTVPNTNDNVGGVTHISVYNISQSDTLMSFSLKFGMRYPGFPIKLADIFDVNSPNAVRVGDKNLIACNVMDTIHGGYTLVCDEKGTILWKDVIRDIIPPYAYGANIFSSPAIGDINGDQVPDVVCAAYFGRWVDTKKSIINLKNLFAIKDSVRKFWSRVYAWNILTGEKLPGFPTLRIQHATLTTPVLADINKDGAKEILIGSLDQKLYAFDGSGNILTGWPVDFHEMIWTTPIWDSINNTIYATSLTGELWAITPRGKIKWKVGESNLAVTTSSPVAGNIEGDINIIISTGEGKVRCIKSDGKIKWERDLGDTSSYSSPALGDIDGDKLLDIIITAGNKLYVLNSNGGRVNNFPISLETDKKFQSSPVVGDINNDGKNEIIIGSPQGQLLAYTNKGKLLKGFPLSTGGSIYSTPLLIDLNQDGALEIFVGCDDGKLYGWTIGKYGKLEWASIYRGRDNNGVYFRAFSISPSPIDNFLTHKFYIYPNPIRDKGWVRYFSGNASSVNIKILNLAGEIIKEYRGKIGKNNYQDVLIPDIPSGVYICRVEVKDKTKTLARLKKFAVVK